MDTDSIAVAAEPAAERHSMSERFMRQVWLHADYDKKRLITTGGVAWVTLGRQEVVADRDARTVRKGLLFGLAAAGHHATSLALHAAAAVAALRMNERRVSADSAERVDSTFIKLVQLCCQTGKN